MENERFYTINKGIGRPVEFKGLKAQYLVIFAVGLLIVFFLFIILFMMGVAQWFCISFGIVAATVLVWLTFKLNRKYGQFGLMKLYANSLHPHFIIHRKAIFRLFSHKKKSV